MNFNECQICYEEYSELGSNTPYIITCGHSLCYDCLNRLYSQTSQSIHCPFCKKFISNKLYTKNYSLIHCISQNNITRNNTTQNNDNSSNEDHSKENEKKQLFEQTVKEYNTEKLLCQNYEQNWTNLTNLMNQTRSQLMLLETLTANANEEYKKSKEKLDCLHSTLQLLQMTYQDTKMTFPDDIPPILPPPPVNNSHSMNTPSSSSSSSNPLEAHYEMMRGVVNQIENASRPEPPPHNSFSPPSRTIIRNNAHLSLIELIQSIDGSPRRGMSTPSFHSNNNPNQRNSRLTTLEEIRRRGRVLSAETFHDSPPPPQPNSFFLSRAHLPGYTFANSRPRSPPPHPPPLPVHFTSQLPMRPHPPPPPPRS